LKALQTKKGETMKKVFLILISLVFITSVTTAPVYAAGGKNHGEAGAGEVDQGDTGSVIGKALGDNARGHQTD
jgi:hypothetical protein